jgi:hypothetical protein
MLQWFQDLVDVVERLLHPDTPHDESEDQMRSMMSLIVMPCL